MTIERLLYPGVIIHWNKPADGMSSALAKGEVVPSIGLATDMTIMGFELKLTTSGEYTRTHDLHHASKLKYTWLDYSPLRTASIAIGSDDILTGWMSGCLIVRGLLNGVTKVFHVGTVSGSPEDNKKVKNNFANLLDDNATGFNPAAAWPESDVLTILKKSEHGNNFKIIAMVTSGGVFYSVLLLSMGKTPNNEDKWAVGGMKQVPAMNRMALYTFLMSIRESVV